MPGFRAHVQHGFDEARALAGSWQPLPPVRVPLSRALGSTLAEPLRALTDVPSYRTSAMDGWAVAGDGPWQLRPGRVLAGAAPEPLTAGSAVEIATGAMLPEGATGVLRREHGALGDSRLSGEPAAGGDWLPVGGECRAGDQLLPAGTPVTPPVVGLAATVGYDDLLVRAAPRVAVAVLGDELLDAGLPGLGRVRDSLSPQLPGWLGGLGAELVSVVRVPDVLERTVEALRVDADVVLTTGGTAAGPVDHVHAALQQVGAEVLVDGVEVRPGHPMVLGRFADGRAYVGLPGNPLSACVSLLTLLAPVLDALRGQPLADLPSVRLGEALRGRDPDSRLVPVEVLEGVAHPVGHIGSAMLRGMARATGVVVVPPAGAAAGDQVRVMRLPWDMRVSWR